MPLGLPCTCTRPHQTSPDALQRIRALPRQGSLGMGIGIALRGSGALWLHHIALDRDAELALVYPSWLRCTQYIPVPYQYPRGSHASWATVSNARADVSSLALVEIPIQLGMAWVALVTREAGEGAYLFSSIYVVALDSSLSVP